MRVVLMVLLAVALAGCGPTKPGVAATVDGTTISMHQVDRAADALCQFGGSSPELSGVEQRQLAASTLILQALAEAERDRLDLPIPRSAVQVTQADRRELQASFGQDTDAMIDVLDARLMVLAVADQLGAAKLGAASLDDLGEEERQRARTLGTELLTARLDQVDVDVDPRLGLGSDLTATAGSGSLSAGEPTASIPFPRSQRCG